MVDLELRAEFSRALDASRVLTRSLAELAERVAVDILADVLPGASVVEVLGGFTEDGLRTLRVRRVLTADATVLFDNASGHDDPRVEIAIDDVNTEYLDLLLELTGDIFMGASTISLTNAATNPDLGGAVRQKSVREP